MNQKPGITSLAMVILMQPDLEAAINFYKNLGLSFKFKMKDTWAEFELNGIKIGLCPHQGKAEDNRSGLVLQVNDLPAFYERYHVMIPFLTKPIEAAHGIMTSIKDPGGNIIDLYQPTPEKLKEMLAQQGCCSAEKVACCAQETKQQCC